MKPVESGYLSELSTKIQTLPPDEASPHLLEGSMLILLAGFPDLALTAFMHLVEGELKVGEKSRLAPSIKSILPSLFCAVGQPCPAIFSDQAMSFRQLGEYIAENRREYERTASIDRWFQVKMPRDDWSQEFLHEITHPSVDIESNERFKVYAFLQDLHRIISVRYISRKKWQDVDRLLSLFEAVIDAWQLDEKGYMEYEIIVFGIRTYLELRDEEKLDHYIQKLWRSEDRPISYLFPLPYFPALIERFERGALRTEINFSREQVKNFIDSLQIRNQKSEINFFVPTVEDWTILLTELSEAIFKDLSIDDIEDEQESHPDVVENRSCLRAGATEDELLELEHNLTIPLPLSYKNFLRASNGFVFLSGYCELFGTDEIKWFADENSDWIEAWDSDDSDITDEQYFQYGEHQDCVWIRSQYMKAALQLSSTEDGYVYLLNPKIIDNRNEWEAWDFGNKLPGAYRYRSFWEMMKEMHKEYVDSEG
ncbi:MAG: SMI1/KNR4 family protein [Spirulina sp. SIO3F2]|nr:SMI1/KNR4 family protein [Spirulina sp. SIO3F2]